MEYGHILKVSNDKFYKEIQLRNEIEQLSIGVGKQCDVRFYKDDFFEDFLLSIVRKETKWIIFCSENLYISSGDVRKQVFRELHHGDLISVRYVDSEQELFSVEFMYDFISANTEYNRNIYIDEISTISIGTDPSADVYISSEFAQKELVAISKNEDYYILNIQETACGIYCNGKQIFNFENVYNGDFLSIADFNFYIKDGCMKTSRSVIVNGLRFYDEPDKNEYPKFKRNTRIKTIIDDEKIQILDPPAIPNKPKNSLLQRLLPAMVMVGTAVVMGIIGGSQMFVFSAISGVMGVVTGIVSIVEGNKDFKKQTEERITKYNAYISNKKAEIAEARSNEEKVLNEIYYGETEELCRLFEFSSDLFDRTPQDDDFLDVRLGIGQIEANREIAYKKQEKLEVEDKLQEMPEELSETYKYVGNAPIVCDLKEANAVGITGSEDNRFRIMKNMVLDICARQYYSDVELVFIAEEKHADKINWLRFLPYVTNNVTGGRNIITDDESKTQIFEFLYRELTIRKENKAYDKNIVVFMYDEYGFKTHPVSRFVEEAGEHGVTFIFFGDCKSDIGQGCSYIIDLKDEKHGALINSEDSNKTLNFEYKYISNEQAEKVVELLAPVYTEEISLESSLTKNITLFRLLNILTIDDIDLRGNWNASQVYKSMNAPIGVSKSGVMSLNLHDKGDGPHGLVAGTTGSGKSELLQTYVLSMAILFHPYEVGFVIIDFKGGGMANQFRDLPHLMGAITNIDGKEINRSLKSIKAELKKRQQYFADAEVNHIDKYIKKYKAGEVKYPLPHLIVIVDEFAELKAEQPDFMKELISAARIGRSLGVHLILATQKPSGQVDEQIWSNSRFKICLKVQTQEDSNEVLKSPLAAEIKEPGRAYIQIGNNEVFELFQSAYCGAPEKADRSNQKEFSIYEIDNAGRRTAVFEQKNKQSNEGSLTQLDSIVNYVNRYCCNNNIIKLSDICLPALEKNIDFPETTLHNKSLVCRTGIGVYDNPDLQYQGEYTIDITTQNTMIIGSAQSGKTNLLQSMVKSLALNYAPDEVNIYIIDFASRIMKSFEGLNHVGGVVTASEDEKLKNLFKMLFGELESRKEKLAAFGVSSFSAYREAGRNDLPQIVLMIDNITALKELYFQDDDDLLTLCREGLSVGISIIIANPQTAGFGYKYLSNFSSRVALFCNDSTEYSSLFDHCRETIENIPGRCLVEVDKNHLDCQLYQAFKGEREVDRVNEIKAFIETVNKRNPKNLASVIPEIPKVFTSEMVVNSLSSYIKHRFDCVIGLDYDTVSPIVINMAAMNTPLAVTGKENSGKHNFMKYCVNMLEATCPEQTEVYIVDSISRKLSDLESMKNVIRYTFMPDEISSMISDIDNKLQRRYEALSGGDLNINDTTKLIVLIVNNHDAMLKMSSDLDIQTAYENIINRYKNLNVCVLFGDYENTNISYSAPEVIRDIRDNRHFIYFDDLANFKINDLSLFVLKKHKKKISLGDAYYIKENECMKVKTALQKM